MWQFYEWLAPAEEIDIAPDFPYYEYNERQMVLRGLSEEKGAECDENDIEFMMTQHIR